MVMGIPTVKRKVKSYLSETLRSLIDKLSPEEKLDCVIIVFVGEVSFFRGRPCHARLLKRQRRHGVDVILLPPQTDVDYVHSVVAVLEKE